jgi:acyl-[acyl-carrier-protein]-phospholipid O-acyltransferase/long-chain-fatty-acid--[acyl-carrier-protein] ligase
MYCPATPFFARLTLRILRVTVVYSHQSCEAVAAGSAIVIANHVSLLDGVIVALASPRPLMFAVDTDFSRRSRLVSAGLSLLVRMGFGSVVPLDTSAPFGMRSLKRAIDSGGNIMVFPEGAISADGNAQPHMPGLEWLIAKTGALLVEVKISGAEESRLFAKSGTRFWPRITVSF